ncbi:apolipoprotein(a)-like isoform X2 [Branchiostoma floridae x Branchiostoma belcheri]
MAPASSFLAALGLMAVTYMSMCEAQGTQSFIVYPTTCLYGGGESYRGTQSTTQDGLTCQAWDSQTPHEHNRNSTNYPNGGLQGNYCRNPDGEPRPWCYTTDPGVRWQYCSIPSCYGQDDCYTGSGHEYRGTANVVGSGRKCQRWDSQSPHPHSYTPSSQPNAGLQEDYCRNPSQGTQPWCYTLDPGTRWEYCGLPLCGSGPTQAPTAPPDQYFSYTSDCYFGSGLTYRGTVSRTQGGVTCQRWDSVTPHDQDYPNRFPFADLRENYCRNPDGPPYTPWCYTTDPNLLWDYCQVPKCYADQCYVPDGADYRGTVAVTSSGRRCQSWNSQSPHQHNRTPQNYPQAGLTNNYCRNPDDDTSPWCYTIDPAVRVEYCPLDLCSGWTGDFILGDDFTVQTTHCVIGAGSSYRGTHSQTDSGLTCQRWDSQTPQQHNYRPISYPDGGLDENYCRNPDGEPRTWCFTTDPSVRWQYCSIPSCFDASECYDGNGESYRGARNVTESGRACQRWDSQSPHPHSRTPENFPSAGLDENFCRNPDGEAEPWCYTQDPNTRWERCALNPCVAPSPTTTVPDYFEKPTSCYFGDGATYRGQVSTTETGITCQRWDSQSPHQHSMVASHPNSGLEENYCRNPDSGDRPWCYTTDPSNRWQYCSIPACYPGDCYTGDGAGYRGTMSVTSSGRQCQPWASQSPHAHDRTPQNYPQAGLEQNYCRNPDDDTSPWCYTVDPTVRVEYCPLRVCDDTAGGTIIGPDGAVFSTTCAFGDGSSYRGTVSQTQSGLTCQRWDSQSPHQHNYPSTYPDAGLDQNYCRNPDGEPRTWCYTTDPSVRWQYCNVPSCFPNQCYSGNGADYRGSVNITRSGRACQRWDSQSPHPHSRTPENFPSAGLDENFCRNPDGEAEPWCYTQDPNTRWDVCVIDSCDPSATPPPSAQYQVFPTDCYFGNGETYRGQQARTKSGIPCQRWDSQTPHQHNIPDRYPTAGLDSNYCRNPDQHDGGPWCYTTNPNTRWEECDVTKCYDDCYLGNGGDYRGRINVTSSGRICQRWDTQTPHAHSRTPDNYPTSGLVDNYCRNPDNDTRPWCYTIDPTARVEYCPLGSCVWTEDVIGSESKVYPKHCYFGDGATYRGTVSMTSGGLTCQRWDSQSPHPHDQTIRHPDAGLDENYCRNPDGEPRTWCYTTDPNVRWQYCTVPQCFSDCYNDAGASYRGTVNITSSGRACQRWDSQTPHPHTRTPTAYPSAGLDQNFCRNPDGEAEPWCYTQDPYVRWEACVISNCDGTVPPPSHRYKVFPENCYFGDGATYRGKVSVSKDGIPCQRWDSQTPHQHDIPSRFPNTELNENYCRNPDGWDRPWCYTTDPNIRWQVCDIPGCFPGECYDDNGVSYRGKVNVTSSGRACQRWDSQTPHQHFNTDSFPQAGLQDNYCRNPNGDVKPWCYTIDPLTRIEFCVVPNCANYTGPQPQKGGRNTGGIVAGAVVAILVLVAAVLGVAYYFLFWRKRMDDGKGLVVNESPVAAGSVGFQDILARDDKTDTEGPNVFSNPNYDMTEQTTA